MKSPLVMGYVSEGAEIGFLIYTCISRCIFIEVI